MWSIVLLLAVLLAGCGGTNLSEEVGVGVVPIARSTVPLAGATNVPVDTPISATFSVAMAPKTITATTFIVLDGVTPVTGTVSLSADGLTATLTPDSALAADTTFTAIITTGAKTAKGVHMTANKIWSFTTGPAPAVVSTVPADHATGVPVTTTITATFSEAMAPSTINTTTFTVKAGADLAPVIGTVSLSADGLIATFTPTGDLAAGTLFNAAITTGAKDLAGNPLSVGAAWSFTTAP